VFLVLASFSAKGNWLDRDFAVNKRERERESEREREVLFCVVVWTK